MYYVSVPSSEPERSNWIAAIEQRQSFNYHLHTFHVCSLHFKTVELIIQGRRKLIAKGAVPSIFYNDDSMNNLHQTVEADSNHIIVENNNIEAMWNGGDLFECHDDEHQQSEWEFSYEEQAESPTNSE